uniref:Reverse transcriptase zinc-binding domain-containing protein n=1 Tax=Fagus sylvatica TaxID=28930 RepID=A0A2N9HTX3_FAGSY
MEALSRLLDQAVREGLCSGFTIVGDVPNIEDIREILGCKLALLPMKYLGLPLGANFKENTIWNSVLEKVERRLAGWKRLYLLKGGKVTLIKSTLSNIPTYFLSLFSILAGMARRLEKLQRDFLWCGLEDQPKYHLWLWRYGSERDALWRLVVDAKYGSLWGGWCSELGKGPYGGAFPELFVISGDREASVDDIMSFPNGILHWDIRFSRNVHDWELESLSSFMELIYSIALKGEGDNKLGWRHNPNKGFSVKEYYRCLNMVSFDPFPWKSIWKAKVPPRVAFFSWTAALGRLLTIDNLRKRHLILVDWCCMCKRSGESVDHLLLHCPMAWELWAVMATIAIWLFGE